jgi:uncharacterized Zn finger protein (UPF0148 family)
MPQCPKCEAELNEDFGMVTCAQCEAVVFIDMEGQAQLASEEPALAPEAAPETLPEIIVPESNPESFGEPALIENYAAMGSLDSFESATDMASQIETADASPLPADDPLGLSAYANSEFSQAKDGPLSYNLRIEGLDSKELRDSLRQAISDSRFSWDADQIMAAIRNGDLRMENLTPIKASILVNRLKRLPLKIQWEQNVVTKM